MKLPLTITFEALSHMKKILSVDKPIILIGVKGGGCNGMKYFIKGMKLDEAAQIKNAFISKHLKLPPVKLHCSMLAEDAIKAAIENYKMKQNKP